MEAAPQIVLQPDAGLRFAIIILPLEPVLPEVQLIEEGDDLDLPIDSSSEEGDDEDSDVSDESSNWWDSDAESTSDDSGYDTMSEVEEDEEFELEDIPDVFRPYSPVVQQLPQGGWEQGSPPLPSGAPAAHPLGGVPSVPGLIPSSSSKRNREEDPSEQGTAKRQRYEDSAPSTSGTVSFTGSTSRPGPLYPLWADDSDSD